MVNLREMPAPMRAPRPITDLAKIFGQFALLQHQFGEQVCALEESVGQQRETLAADGAEMKKKIAWLSRQGESVQERIARVEAEVRTLTEATAEWSGTLDQMIALLVKVRSSAARA